MLEKNLEALKKNNPALADKLEKMALSPKTVLFLGTNEDVNIAHEDIALHRMDDPLGEAREVFEANVQDRSRGDNGVLLIFGMGLGYLLRRTFINTTGQIIIYEPYLEVLRLTLEAVDFSQELGSKRVSIITDLDQVLPALTKRYLMGDNFKTFALPANKGDSCRSSWFLIYNGGFTFRRCFIREKSYFSKNETPRF